MSQPEKRPCLAFLYIIQSKRQALKILTAYINLSYLTPFISVTDAIIKRQKVKECNEEISISRFLSLIPRGEES